MQLTILSFGVRVGVDCADPSLAESIIARFPPGWKETTGTALDRSYSILPEAAGRRARAMIVDSSDGPALHCSRCPWANTHAAHPCSGPPPFATIDELLDWLEGDLHLYVASRARGYVFVHAGAVVWHDVAIVLPGCSFSGKSTLVTALIAAGATGYSDEYAVFDDCGRLFAFPRPIRIRSDADRTVTRIPLPGGTPETHPHEILLLFSEFRPGARWHPRRVSPATAVMQLLANTVAAQACPQSALSVLGRMAERAVAFHSWREEADRTAQSLLDLCRIHFPSTGGSNEAQSPGRQPVRPATRR
jgi:hypothetical protein